MKQRVSLTNTTDESGTLCDEAPLDLVDFSISVEDRVKAERWWDVAIGGEPLNDGEREEDFRTFYKKEYYLETYHDKEHYVKAVAGIHTYAILTPDGEWIEPGKMGWWGVSLANGDSHFEFNENYDKVIDRYRGQGMIISIVDCHI